MIPAKLVTVVLGGQVLGIDVARVQDVIRLGTVSPVPLAPHWIAGVMNLRGRIVTAIDLRARFDLPPRQDRAGSMCVVVEHQGEPYGFIVDDVGDVIDLAPDQIEANPPTLDRRWQQVSDGIVKLDVLMVLASVRAIMDTELAAAA